MTVNSGGSANASACALMMRCATAWKVPPNDALGRAAVRRLRPGEHVIRCPPREGEKQDAARLHALVAQPGGARHERAGLASTGPASISSGPP